MSDNCVFCKIVKKEIPAHVVYEDEDFIAFLDINPRSAGHVQVIPKTHYRWVWDVPNVSKYFEIVRKIAKAQQRAFSIEGIWSRVTGEDVPHAHIWIFPDPRVSQADSDPKDFVGNCAKIKAKL